MTADERHPFLEGLSKHRGAPPTVLIIFGASGDLTSRKLIPALYNLSLDHLLPSEFHLVGFGRKSLSDDAFRELSKKAVEEFSRRPIDDDSWSFLHQRLHYHSGGYDDPKAYKELHKILRELEKKSGRKMQYLFYISTPPSVFVPVIENIGRSGLASHLGEQDHDSKLIIEKPFGHDLASAIELNSVLNQHFAEKQIYRIDHYLGKETVQDLLVQRFGNSIFEPIWNRQYVESVQITVAEDIGVGSRAGYYDSSGALRDMIQNHAMQLVALTAMEPPVSLDPEAIRDEKVKVLRAIQALNPKVRGGDVVRARYSEGLVKGEKVKGYLQEDGVPASSTTETYVALRFLINNWRWKGVPFYVRSGKRLPRRLSEIAVQFKRPPGILFSEGERFDLAPNTMVIRIQPDEGLTLLLNSKIPGLETRTQPVKMHFRYAATFGSNTPEAYERLIMDAMIGDGTLFIRGDETETSWRLLSPVLDHWKTCRDHGLESYTAGSWGPLAAEQLLWDGNHQWRKTGT